MRISGDIAPALDTRMDMENSDEQTCVSTDHINRALFNSPLKSTEGNEAAEGSVPPQSLRDNTITEGGEAVNPNNSETSESTQSTGTVNGPKKSKRIRTPSAKKEEATRNALEMLGMSTSKRNMDTANRKKSAAQEAAKKRRVSQLETTIKQLEEKEKVERESLAKLKRQKVKYDRQIVVLEKVKFPVADETIEVVDKKGGAPTPLPIPVMRLELPDDQVTDVLFVWDFLNAFNKELNLKSITIDDFVDLLHYTGGESVALTEVFCTLLRLVLRDHSLSVRVSNEVPPHLNFASRDGEEDALEDMSESACIERYRDWEYNGLKLLPRRIRPEVVDGLRWQSVARAIIPRLPSYTTLLRATDSSLDMLMGSEQREGVDKDGYKVANRDWVNTITYDCKGDVERISTALKTIESTELYNLPAEQKLSLLKVLCYACYDTSHVRHLLSKNVEERLNRIAAMNNAQKTQKKKAQQESAALKQEAIEECRRINQAAKEAGTVKGTKKNSKASEQGDKPTKAGKAAKNPYDPTPAQLNAMLEDMILKDAIGVDVVLEEPPSVEEDSDVMSESTGRSRMLSSTRVGAAEQERRRKEREQEKQMREDAAIYLEQALESGRDRDIRESLKYSRQAGLEGELPDGRVYCTTTMFKVYKLRASMEQASKDARAAAEHEKALVEYFVRTEPIGYDRYNRAYWCFDGDTRVFVQTMLGPDSLPSNEKKEDDDPYLSLMRKKPSLKKCSWRMYGSMSEIWALIDALDERGIRERALKSKLRAQFGLSENSAQGVTYKTSGSEFIGKKVQRTFGKRVVYGTIVGWLPPEGEDEALWHVIHDDGDEEDLDENEVNKFLHDVPPKPKRKYRERSEDSKSKSGVKATAKRDVEEEQSAMEVDGESEEAEWSGDDDDDTPPDIVTDYHNNVIGGLGVRENQIGLHGLKLELSRKHDMLIDGLKSRGSGYPREGKRVWENCLRTAEDLSTVRSALVELETVVHDTQEVPDEVDEKDTKDKRDLMMKDGWVFNIEAEGTALLDDLRAKAKKADEVAAMAMDFTLEESEPTNRRGKGDKSMNKKGTTKTAKEEAADCAVEVEKVLEHLRVIGRRARTFFEGHGASDGTIVAYLPGSVNDGIPLWHMEHDDGDNEDLDSKDLTRVLRNYDTDAQNEEGIDDEDEDEDEASDSEEEESEEEEEDDEDREESKVLWPSLNVRTRWLQALHASQTISEVALALSSFMEHAKAYGVVGPDPLGSLGPRARSMWNSSRDNGKSPGRSTMHGHGSSRKRRSSVGRRSSAKASEGSRRMQRDRAARKRLSYAE